MTVEDFHFPKFARLKKLALPLKRLIKASGLPHLQPHAFLLRQVKEFLSLFWIVEQGFRADDMLPRFESHCNVFGMKRIEGEGITLSGINGNIELQLGSDVNADFDARGMNGQVISEMPNVAIEKTKSRSYWARIGTGGTGITAKGINGNIRFTENKN